MILGYVIIIFKGLYDHNSSIKGTISMNRKFMVKNIFNGKKSPICIFLDYEYVQ